MNRMIALEGESEWQEGKAIPSVHQRARGKQESDARGAYGFAFLFGYEKSLRGITCRKKTCIGHARIRSGLGGKKLPTEAEESAMSLEEFVKLPTTVAFDVIYSKQVERFLSRYPFIKGGTKLGTGYMPLYINSKHIPMLLKEFGNTYLLYPAILSPLDDVANTEAGITKIVSHPNLNISGQGVIIGIIDTGIDYTQEVFRYEDGTSKIINIWDQTLEGSRRASLYYGAEFTRDQINEALRSEDPFAIVPTKDTDGHGTFLASVAAARETNDYIGASPGAELVVVKLKRAHPYFIEDLLIPPDNPNLYQNVDVMLGMQYIVEVARQANAPVVFCIGLGSNATGHDGFTYFEQYISYLSQRPGYAVVTAGGNESNAKHHTQGKLFRTGSTDNILIRVGEEASFKVTILGATFDKFSVGITSPSGESISRVPFYIQTVTREELLFEKTTITIEYNRALNTVISVGFIHAKEGEWIITLYGDSVMNGEYHAWLPITGQVSPEVEFLKPFPEYTIVYPASSLRSTTCGAYDTSNNSLYVSSSWGPTRLPRIAPDFVAPGVNVVGIYPMGMGTMTGTSTAAAVTAGAAANLMEWGIVQGNMPSMDGDLLRRLLISGCRREEGEVYPNIRWGYGKLDLYETMWRIRESRAN